jgi:hypothetical protein
MVSKPEVYCYVAARVEGEAAEGVTSTHATVATGTVHREAAVSKRRLGFWALGTPAAGLYPQPAREKGFPSNLLLLLD